jgi:hypothetical protein
MPIRFRCLHCDKLLGIGRRKAGAMVNCPSCSRTIQVPNLESVAVSPEELRGIEQTRNDLPPPLVVQPEKKKLLGAPLFENSDFEELLNPVALGGPEPKSKKRQRESPPPLPLDSRVPPPPPPPAPKPIAPVGIVISPSRATWLSVGAVFVLAIVFTLGLVVGRFLKP